MEALFQNLTKPTVIVQTEISADVCFEFPFLMKVNVSPNANRSMWFCTKFLAELIASINFLFFFFFLSAVKRLLGGFESF